MGTKKSVLLIGAGFGGLATACLLAKEGYKVTVIEQLDQPGGRARLYTEQGFSFDMGPSWYLMPDIFEKFFAQFGKRPEDYLTLTRLDPAYKMYFGKDDVVTIREDLATNKELFERYEKGAGEKLQTYLDAAQYQYQTAMSKFIYKNYTSLKDMLDPKLAKAGLRMRLFASLDKYASRYFSNDRLKKILEYTVVFLGGDPKNTPALYSLMSHVDFNLGVWYPKGGMNALAVALYDLAQELGVTFAFNTSAQHILVEEGKAKGVKTPKKIYKADIVVCNADYHHVEQQLLKPKYQSYTDKYWKSRTVAPSGFVMYLGLNKKIKGLEHHMLFLEEDWQEHFREIFEKPAWPQHPSFYVCCPSKTDKTVAPKGKENIFVLVPVAAGLEDDETKREAYADMILSRMEDVTGEQIKKHIIVQRLFAHNDFIKDYNAFQGTALGLAHTLRQTALFRPRMQNKKVKNLWFVGQYTHPGIGVPMVIIAAEILAQEVAKRGNK
ncbi:phytoene desaturase [Candidatus Woesearchaeota archaeon]|nr:phytoene desaturase [Candidatus Woesearchaeota archaeon]